MALSDRDLSEVLTRKECEEVEKVMSDAGMSNEQKKLFRLMRLYFVDDSTFVLVNKNWDHLERAARLLMSAIEAA